MSNMSLTNARIHALFDSNMPSMLNKGMMSENILDTLIYPSLHSAKLTKSRRHFSEVWLERCPRYMSEYRRYPARWEVLKVILPKLRAKGLHDLAAIVVGELMK